MTTPDPWRGPDRRDGEDLWLRLIRWLAGLGWLALACALVLLGRARPEVETFFDRYYRIPLRGHWDLPWARGLFYAMLAGLLVSGCGLLLNLRRRRRRADGLRWSLVFVALVSLAGIVAYLVNF